MGRRFESSPRHQRTRRQRTNHPLVMRWVEVRILSAAPAHFSPAENYPPTRHAWVRDSNPLRGTRFSSRMSLFVTTGHSRSQNGVLWTPSPGGWLFRSFHRSLAKVLAPAQRRPSSRPQNRRRKRTRLAPVLRIPARERFNRVRQAPASRLRRRLRNPPAARRRVSPPPSPLPPSAA